MKRTDKEAEVTKGLRFASWSRGGDTHYFNIAAHVTADRVHSYVKGRKIVYWDTKREGWISEDQYDRIQTREARRLADVAAFRAA